MPKGNGAADAMEIALVDLPETHPCSDCGACCDYIAVEIDSPTTFKDYENIRWYLTHVDVSVYVDWEGDWFIEFKAACVHQNPSKTCGIYEERPEMCSSFSWEECEKTVREPAHKYRFLTPDEFFSWVEKTRPAAYKRYLKSRRSMLEKRAKLRKEQQGARKRTEAPTRQRPQPTA